MARKLRCPDCGMMYEAGAPHQMFCRAKTCDNCGTTYGEVIEPDAEGNRICESCQEEA